MKFKRGDELKQKLERFREQFKEHKMTPQRRVVLQALLENSESHLSAEEVYALAKEIDSEIGLATIYRTLDLLEELNIVHKLHFGDGRSRYELCHVSSEHHHHHLVCLNCNQILEVKEDLLHQLETVIEKEHGFHIIDHRVQFYGYCAQCDKTKSNT
ncbi:ferric uptake regulator, Fur family [Dethiobacter alkaliphilus AHT 1]|uniref:Ferric uptake regulator, Fur family n=1 Tax=Dethiobacter alkaliphilus AHT 1 TaxID=555088 RepID=C0GGE7_DETAL|nr:ferric uptake regulator, Fur family [Dethiobacter alkaliphilus AHT 1]